MSRFAHLPTAAFAVALILLTALTGVALRGVDQLENATAWTLHSREVLTRSDRLRHLINEVEGATLGYAATGDARYAERCRTAAVALPGSLSNLAPLVADNQAQ